MMRFSIATLHKHKAEVSIHRFDFQSQEPNSGNHKPIPLRNCGSRRSYRKIELPCYARKVRGGDNLRCDRGSVSFVSICFCSIASQETAEVGGDGQVSVGFMVFSLPTPFFISLHALYLKARWTSDRRIRELSPMRSAARDTDDSPSVGIDDLTGRRAIGVAGPLSNRGLAIIRSRAPLQVFVVR